eukprot:TRINITY_DN23896_c0_g1_i1.p1 TRINITY_DN23896_c0_g1~~TRINITY_DN23896_c0_g1_i1.p1  ORF type:complete len:131 (+),score=47.96 TRINITY_DN23896_c0_g1_i1:48-440(+)
MADEKKVHQENDDAPHIIDGVAIRPDLGESSKKGTLETVASLLYEVKDTLGLGDYAKDDKPQNRYTGSAGPAQNPEYYVPGGKHSSNTAAEAAARGQVDDSKKDVTAKAEEIIAQHQAELRAAAEGNVPT